MKYIYLDKNVVIEILPEIDPVFPEIPIQARYSPSFLNKCILIEDEVEVQTGNLYNPETQTFTVPIIEVPVIEPVDDVEPQPTLSELLQQNITVLQLAVAELTETAEAQDIANKLAIAELAEATMGGES